MKKLGLSIGITLALLACSYQYLTFARSATGFSFLTGHPITEDRISFVNIPEETYVYSFKGDFDKTAKLMDAELRAKGFAAVPTANIRSSAWKRGKVFVDLTSHRHIPDQPLFGTRGWGKSVPMPGWITIGIIEPMPDTLLNHARYGLQ